MESTQKNKEEKSQTAELWVKKDKKNLHSWSDLVSYSIVGRVVVMVQQCPVTVLSSGSAVGAETAVLPARTTSARDKKMTSI